MKKKVLSISILISNNRAETIEKCMKSLVPLREAVPSELIIVDTGCKDEGIDIARQYADKVVEFTWCNDFAAARNAGLKECSGEWFLFMDDDEWFEDVSELIDFFNSELRNTYDALWYLVRNYENFEGTKYTESFVGRVVKLTDESKFYGKIHEWIEPFPTKIKKVSSYAHHYGYVYKSEEERQKHFDRNISLEEEAVNAHPEDIRMCCQLVQEYRAAERYTEAEKLCKKTLKETTYKQTNSFVQYLLAVLPQIYVEQKRYDDALAEFERQEKSKNLLSQTKRKIHYEKAILLGIMERFDKIQIECRKFFEEHEAFLKDRESMEHEIMDFAHYSSEKAKGVMMECALFSMISSKEYDNAEFFFDRVDWTQTKPYPYEALTALLQIYRESNNSGLLMRYLPKILEQDEMSTRFYGTIHNIYATYPEFREQLLEDLEMAGYRSGNLAYFHLLYLEKKGLLAAKDAEEYYAKSDRKYDEEVLALVLCKKEVLSLPLRYATWEVYQQAVEMDLKELSNENVDDTIECFLACEDEYPENKRSFFLYGKAVLRDRALRLYAVEMQKDEFVIDNAKVCELLEEYVLATTEYCEFMYHPSILMTEDMFALPVNYRFAYRIKRALTAEDTMATFSANIKEAAILIPEFLPMLRILVAEKEAQCAVSKKVNNPASELLQLAETLKTTVRNLIAGGQFQEAEAILAELKELMPEDKEVEELLLSIG